MTIGEQVVAHFRSYAPSGYTFMETWGPNRGPVIDRWAATWGMRGVAWCGIGQAGVIREVSGGWTAYRGAEFLSPSVALIEAHGRSLGWAWRGEDRLPAGAVATYGGDEHTNMVVLDHGVIGGAFTAIGANESGGIRVSERSTYGCRLWVPAALARPPMPGLPSDRFDYCLEDPRAKQFVILATTARSTRDKRIADIAAARGRKPGETQEAYERRVPKVERRLAAYKRYHPRPHRRVRGGRTEFLIIGGPISVYGPYDTAAQREDAFRLLVPRLRALHRLAPSEVVMRKYRVPDRDYLDAVDARREWLAKYGS